jgi:hypothetical protein
MEDDLQDTMKKLAELMKNREKDLEIREEELKKLKARLEEEYPNHGQADDVLDLNIGGTPTSVLRRTLTQIDGSMLAAKFSGRWDESLTKDANGRFFIDQDFALFERLINFLRELSCQTESTEFPMSPKFQDMSLQRSFNTMVEYYGLTLGVFPINCYMYDKGKELVVKYRSTAITSSEKTTYLLMPTENSHRRFVKSYEVSLGLHSTVQIGWASPTYRKEAAEFDSEGHVGVGYSESSVAFDSARNAVVFTDDDETILTKCGGIEIKEGTVIRCQDKGSVWMFDGEAKVSQVSLSLPGTILIHCTHIPNAVPCITIKGTFHISHIQLEAH